MLDAAKNFAKTTLSTGYNSAATSIVLSSGDGAKLPAVPFNATWWNFTDFPDPADDADVEIVRVTARSTDTLTVTRGQEGTSASNKNIGGKTYKLVAGLTAKTINTDAPASFAGGIFYSQATWTFARGAVAARSGNFSTGIKILVGADGQSIAGIRIGWNSTGGAQTVKVTLWDNGSGGGSSTSLGTATVAVNASGLYEAFFSAPIAVTKGNFYTCAMWENSGTNYMGSSDTNNSLNAPYGGAGPYAVVATAKFGAGDVDPTSDGGDRFATEPIFL